MKLGFGSPCAVVRSARAGDARALAQVFRDSWRATYTGIIPGSHLDGMLRRRPAAWWTRMLDGDETVLAVELAGKVVGYARCGPTRSRGRYAGEIFELYVAPVHQGLGLGEQLFESCRWQLDRRGLAGMILWVLAENSRAIDFYWSRGGRPVAKVSESMGGRKIEKLALAWD